MSDDLSAMWVGLQRAADVDHQMALTLPRGADGAIAASVMLADARELLATTADLDDCPELQALTQTLSATCEVLLSHLRSPAPIPWTVKRTVRDMLPLEYLRIDEASIDAEADRQGRYCYDPPVIPGVVFERKGL